MISSYLSKLDLYKNIINSEQSHIINGNEDFLLSSVICDFKMHNNTIFVIYPNLYQAQKAYDKLTNLLNDEDILFYPGDELIVQELLDVSGDFKYERINTIISLLKEDKKYIVILNLNSAIKYVLEQNKWTHANRTIKKGEDIDVEEFCNYLTQIGYTNNYTVTKTGEFSRRGEIIDIYPLNYLNPIRIDLFDTEIESIKEFDIESQKSIREINLININPVFELFYDESELEYAILKIEQFKKNHSLSLEESNKIDNDILNLNLKTNIDNMLTYIPYFSTNKTTIFDYASNKRIYMYDIAEIKSTYNRICSDLLDYFNSINMSNLFNKDLYVPFSYLENNANVISEGLSKYFDCGIDPQTNNIEQMKGIPETIVSSLKNYLSEICIVPISNELRLIRLKDILLENSIPYKSIVKVEEIKKGQVNIIYGSSFLSLSLLDKKINIINENTLFETDYKSRRPKYKSIYKNTSKVSHYNELKLNDYVVHFDYGVGVYQGLQTLNSQGRLRDYLKIQYEDGSLYIPLEQINKIEKFNTGEIDNVKINKLKSKSWEQAKEKVRKKVKDISDKLIKIYALREASTGIASLPDSTLQLEFENKFPYELTADQARAINDVKRDMESDKVMDRLICGDVGYGKTEVALRAAFKAVLSNKQVALLAPTTLLSRQHYITFKSRMSEFGVRVELINRFIPKKQQNEIIEDTKNGKVDILIGTHRILSSEIEYKDLGLLIIDEEQRFGVMHKEKLREMKENVDTITLSATPIPRTLQMSISGMKDLSMIETPPKNRYPIQTYVLERNDSIIRDAIEREIARGGQVFYMYNLVSDIESVASHIQTLVPEARICIGHGKMDKDELEDTISDFISHKYDVLICTTIIETGIDIPDCNTLIIHDTTRLGLSQLYQLRGRVGRSDRIAYAYLMYQKDKILTENTKKRLEAIKEFNELGSGYKIAMRDLAIRGAGDILGGEQSGFISSVGLETFMAILNEELAKLKNNGEIKPINNQVNDVLVNRTIDNSYISNDDVKIEIHKKIDKLENISALETLSSELIDRFGQYDNKLKDYMYEKLFNKLINKAGIERIDNNDYQIMLIYSREATYTQDGNKMFDLANKLDRNIKLSYINKQIIITYKKSKDNPNYYLEILSKYLDSLYNNKN